jgi:hypothetical protein
VPLQKILFKPGVNRENTRYTTEGGWYECDKIRFRQGNPEVIGGWQQFSSYTFNGVCRSLWNWITLGSLNLIGVGTNTKFYIERGGAYYDITPIQSTVTLGTNPFATNGTTTVTVTATGHGATTGTFVTFSGATGTYASTFNAEYQITVVNSNSYTITVPTALSGGPYGGSAVVAAYQINAGPAYAVPLTGWGAGPWGSGTWGTGTTGVTSLQLWNQMNYGENLLYGPRGGNLYYWTASSGVTTRGVALNTLGGTATFTNSAVTTLPTVVTSTIAYTEGAALQFAASGSLPAGISASTTYYAFNVSGLTFNLLNAAGNQVSTTSTGSGVYVSLIVDMPTKQNSFIVSDSSRFVIVFGCNDYGSSTIDPMLIRWSGQQDLYNWTPDATNQAGFTRLSHGSQIVTYVQTRQEIVVLTDSSVYSLQYLGPPYVWAPQLLGDNISIVSPNAAVIASGIVYWMGVDKFYMYDGRVQTLNCDLRRYVFQDLNIQQNQQIFCSTNEGFNEVWWFYCSANANYVDKYVVYNYAEKIWYYGTLSRSAWMDSGLLSYPVAASYDTTTGTGRLINHESGINNNETSTTLPLNAYISSSEFDIGDGHNFGFVWRILPDLTFNNSSDSPTGTKATVTMELYGLTNSGSGATSDASQPVRSSNAYNITEEFTGQIFTRFRGRQMIFKISSNQVNTTWQLGAPRIDIRQDGRR